MYFDYGKKPIPIAHQAAGLMRYWPQGKTKITQRNRALTWQGVVQPSPFSREYELLLEYKISDKPRLFVVAPDLKILAGEKTIPHIYPNKTNIKGTLLCLYLPKLKSNPIAEWHANRDQLAQTVIPWAVLWLFYFENWLYSDIWDGGGVHPVVD